MDALAFANSRKSQWQRLEQLAKQRTLNGVESDEFYQLYQRVASDLAFVRTNAPDPEVVLRLSAILGLARAKLTTPSLSFSTLLSRFFLLTLPYAMYRIRWWTAAVSGICIALAGLVLFSYMLNPELLAGLGSERELDQYANQAFAAYYHEHTNANFAGIVWTNNAWIALQTVAGGFTGIWPIYVLGANSVMVGQAAAIMESRDVLSLFFQLILPHGFLELCAIFVGGAAGLRLFWAWVVPCNKPRVAALADEGRNTVLVGIGLIFVLFVSGLVEGFVTPSALWWQWKILIGLLVFLAYWGWVLYFGTKASRDLHLKDPLVTETGWQIKYA